MKNETEVIKRFLHEIKDDILSIDSGCQTCIRKFCKEVNEVLVKHDIKLDYDPGSDDEELKIT